MSKYENTILELQNRWDKIRIANLFDALESLGYSNQCLDLGIKPLFPNQHLAGVALTARGARDPRPREDPGLSAGFQAVQDAAFPGCVLIIDTGGEPWAGKYGEMSCWSIQQKGCKGIVHDGYIRDSQGLEIIPDFTACVRGTSPVESMGKWRTQEINLPIAVPGTVTNQVAVFPGDWIVGGPDGVIVVPQDIAMDVLVIAEDIEEREQKMREDLAAGLSFKEAYEKWERA